jgi:hypothetical protein
VLARWSGESQIVILNNGARLVVDRFILADGVEPRALPRGVKVAGPWYDNNNLDSIWVTQTEFAALASANEVPGRLFAVMYDPDGTVVTRNSASDTDELYVDFDRDGFQDVLQSDPLLPDGNSFWENDHPLDENNLNPVPFLAVFDDEEAREIRTNDWTTLGGYQDDLTGPGGFVNEFGRRIHFNRYTGVVMTPKDRG